MCGEAVGNALAKSGVQPTTTTMVLSRSLSLVQGSRTKTQDTGPETGTGLLSSSVLFSSLLFYGYVRMYTVYRVVYTYVHTTFKYYV